MVLARIEIDRDELFAFSLERVRVFLVE